jgi:small subunit ribosomal protein S20
MPKIKSQISRLITNERDTKVNKSRKSQLKTEMKKFDAALATNKKEDIIEAVKAISSALDSTARAKTIHKNRASRTKSRLQKKVNKLTNTPK